MGTVRLLVSPAGGRGRALAAAGAVRSVIEAAGHEVADISGDSAEASERAARAAVAAGAGRLLAVGGDGTVNIAAQAAAETDTVLGIVPAGTGNDFARAVGLFGAGVERAAARALGPDRYVDAIRVTRSASAGQPPRWSTSVVTGGFSADVNARAERVRFPKGASRYTVATLLTVARLRHRRLAFTVDGQRHEFTCALWAVANTRSFGGGMAICPDADPRDGLLDLTVVGKMGRATLLRLLPTVFKGTHVRHPDVVSLRGRAITVDDASPAGSQIGEAFGDGEPMGSPPITFEAVPAALRLAAD